MATQGRKPAAKIQPTSLQDPEQEKLLEEAIQMVNKAAWRMKRQLDDKDIMGALKHASDMISELRTSLLSPHSYNSLYMVTTEHLRHFVVIISDHKTFGVELHDLYKLVQHCGNIIPRLYLLITVGSIFIKSKEVPARDVLKDLVALCGGVQHATRGLFLRNYLSEMTKDILPDEGGQYEGQVTDSIDFTVTNFTEMNKLWVRMQHGQGLVRDPAKREEERRELNILVCKNLNRLSSLEGLTIGVYSNDVLPKILTQVRQCADRIAQQFLMDSLIQTISDEYHLRTLSQIFEACAHLEAGVNAHAIVTSLINRLTHYLELNPHAKSTVQTNLFALFFEYTEKAAKEDKNQSLPGILGLCQSLLQFAFSVYPDEFSLIDSVYDFVASLASHPGVSKPDCIKELVRVLEQPVTRYGTVLLPLKIKSYEAIIGMLPYDDQREVAKFLIANLLTKETKLASASQVDTFLKYIRVLITADSNDSDGDSSWEDDQASLASAISLFVSDDVDEMGCILLTAHGHLKEGGKKRIKFTLVPLVFKSLSLVQRIFKSKKTDESWDRRAKKIFKFANDLLGALKAADHLHLCFRLYLECALAADRCGLNNHAYGLLSKGAIELYEADAMSKSAVEYTAIRLLITTVNQMESLDREKRAGLAKRLAQHSVKLINMDDQSRVLQMGALLFSAKVLADAEGTQYLDSSGMSSCLERAYISATEVHDQDLTFVLLVELLDTFLYFFVHHEEVVTAKKVLKVWKGLKEFGHKSLKDSNPSLEHLKNIQAHIAFKQTLKNNAKSIIEEMEAEHYLTNPLPVLDPKDPNIKAKTTERDKIKEQTRNSFKPAAETKAKLETEKWNQITFRPETNSK